MSFDPSWMFAMPVTDSDRLVNPEKTGKTDTTMTGLDRLNHLLATTPGLDLPSFRQEVDASGANHHWLRKAMSKNPAATDEIKELLSKDLKTLLQPLPEKLA